VRSATEALADDYGLPGASLAPIASGHTNESLAVDAPGGRFVLRLAWRGKPLGAVLDEERLLRALRPTGITPRVVPTRAGAPRAAVLGRVAHLFERLPGAVVAAPSVPQTRAALATLADLHAALRAVPRDGADPVELLRARRGRVFGDASARWPADVAAALPRVRRRIDDALDAASALSAQRAQWLHGDYHPGNVLFSGDAVTGVVDLDDCGAAVPAVDLAVALYTFSRDAAHEPALRFDPERWRAGAAAYAARGGGSPWRAPDPLAEAIFCAHQALLHLDAARRGLWALAPGIGFYPCFNALAGA
jgi:Ser/Thr protein kinase RdoA (MazF antagonist)